jgi:hypothetical protein
MAKVLDREKDYAEIRNSSIGARYFQDGAIFNTFGREIDEQGNEIPAPAQAAPAPRPSTPKLAEAATTPAPAINPCARCGFVGDTQWTQRMHEKACK